MDPGRTPLKVALHQALRRLPGAPDARHPQGTPFVEALCHGSLSVELYVPCGADLQTPHTRDELYVVVHGQSAFEREDGLRCEVRAGDVLFVPAGLAHRFIDFTPGFATWVVFYGPEGGEAAVQAAVAPGGSPEASPPSSLSPPSLSPPSLLPPPPSPSPARPAHLHRP